MRLNIDYEHISFGGGVDSTALLIEWWRKELKPIDIIFSDTGIEQTKTYEHVAHIMKLAQEYGHKTIVVGGYERAHQDGNYTMYPDYYSYCFQNKIVPLRAYRKECTYRFKIVPSNRYIRSILGIKNFRNKNILSYIGYNYDEKNRINDTVYKWQQQIFPLIEWKLGRKHVKQICRDYLGYVPIKSRCIICPNQNPIEWNYSYNHHKEIIDDLVINAQSDILNFPITKKDLGINPDPKQKLLTDFLSVD